MRSHYRTGLKWAIWVTSFRMRREDRSSISSHPLADLGGKQELVLRHCCLLIGLSVQFLCSCHEAVPSFPGCISRGRRAQGLSRLAALCGHPQGLALTAPSTVPRSSRLGRSRTCPHAFEVALLVENGPGDARELVGKRDRQHVAVPPLLGGFDPRLEPVALPALRSDQYDPGRLHEQYTQVAIA